MTVVELSAQMHCRSCEQRVLRAVRGLDGVHSVNTDLKHQSVSVEFDEGRVDELKVRRAVAGALSHGLPGT